MDAFASGCVICSAMAIASNARSRRRFTPLSRARIGCFPTSRNRPLVFNKWRVLLFPHHLSPPKLPSCRPGPAINASPLLLPRRQCLGNHLGVPLCLFGPSIEPSGDVQHDPFSMWIFHLLGHGDRLFCHQSPVSCVVLA